MSKKKVTQEIQETEEKKEVIPVEVEAEVIEELRDIKAEVIEEKKENKVLKVLRKVAPFAIGIGVALVAFVAGKASADDDIYIQKLEAECENSEGDETEADTDEEESTDAEVQDD